jgi:hypothetical protein
MNSRIPSFPMPELNPEPTKEERYVRHLVDLVRNLRREVFPIAFARFLAKLGPTMLQQERAAAIMRFEQRWEEETEEILAP